MAWNLEFDPAAIKDLDRLDNQVRNRILTFIKTRLANADDPTKLGRILHGRKSKINGDFVWEIIASLPKSSMKS
jgi:mRNA-degrading endonuclease RelE of RelBE toxin-antitoxin system